MSILKVKDKDGNVHNISAIIGPQGPQGIPGPKGKDGQRGADGQPGANGDEIRSINCRNGVFGLSTYSPSTSSWKTLETPMHGFPMGWYVDEDGYLYCNKVSGYDWGNGSVSTTSFQVGYVKGQDGSSGNSIIGIYTVGEGFGQSGWYGFDDRHLTEESQKTYNAISVLASSGVDLYNQYVILSSSTTCYLCKLKSAFIKSYSEWMPEYDDEGNETEVEVFYNVAYIDIDSSIDIKGSNGSGIDGVLSVRRVTEDNYGDYEVYDSIRRLETQVGQYYIIKGYPNIYYFGRCKENIDNYTAKFDNMLNLQIPSARYVNSFYNSFIYNNSDNSYRILFDTNVDSYSEGMIITLSIENISYLGIITNVIPHIDESYYSIEVQNAIRISGINGQNGKAGTKWYPTSSSFDRTDTTVTIEYTEIGSGAGVPDPSRLNLFAILKCNLNVGTQYKVDFDGVIYDCECFKASTGSPSLGSESLMGRSITYPFFVIQEQGGTFCAASDTEKSHTITIYEPSENSIVDIGVAEVNDLIFSTTTNDLYQVQNKSIDYYESDNKKKIDIVIDLNWLSLLKGSNGLSVKSATAQYVNENSVPTLKFTFTMSDNSTLPVNVDLTQFKQEIIDEINAQYTDVSEVGQ